MKKDGSIGFGLRFGMFSVFGMCAGMFMLILLTLFLAGCSLNRDGEETSIAEEFRGGWNCEENPLEDPDAYTGYFFLDISDDGSFSMFDIEAGNPGIEGRMEVISEDKLIMHVKKTPDTDIPNVWAGMSLNQEMAYSFTDDGKLEISYSDQSGSMTLVFFKRD